WMCPKFCPTTELNMIVYRELPDGGVGPVIQCDACGEPVRSTAEGGCVVLCDRKTALLPEKGAPVSYVHKGACFGQLMAAAREQNAGLLDWELSDHLVGLCEALDPENTPPGDQNPERGEVDRNG